MSEAAGHHTESAASGATPRSYAVGTLKYTTFGMVMLFIWLLWGDFIWVMLDQNLPNILPLKLKELGASDTFMVFMNKTLAYGVAFVFAPMVSFKSDRYRSRWGRRIPFLFWSTPFVGLFLILIGCYENIVSMMVGNADTVMFLGLTVTRGSITLILFAVLLVGFDFANIFVNTVYWYLFNDVVPEKYLSRFLSLFRMAGIAAGMVYSKWIFPHSMDHFKFVFVVGGIAYVVGFLVMCFMVREGDYPPPPENIDKGHGFISSAKTFLRECFTHRFYWYFFLSSTCMFLAWQSCVFAILRNTKSLGLSLQQLGDMGFYIAPISFLCQYPAGWLADKYNPVRIYIVTSVICALSILAQCIWIFKDFGPSGNLVLMYIISLVFLPVNAINGAAELPMCMRLLPKDRYGQFCSANAMLRSFAMIFGSVLAGVFMDILEAYYHMGDWRYRYYPVWTLFFYLCAITFLLLLYKEWKERGGDSGYTPPSV